MTSRMLELRALLEAEWATVKTNSARWDLSANLGAGRIDFATLWHFEREAPRPVAWRHLHPRFEEQRDGFDYDGTWWDGGDVLLYLVHGYSRVLEGAVHRPRERREEERRRAQDD